MPAMASFEQVAASFWRTDAKHGGLAPLTNDIVAEAERSLGNILPADLLRLLRIQNGGAIAADWDACPAEPNFYAETHVPFDALFGIGPADQATTITMLDTAYLIQEWELPTSIVLLAGEGHYWVALDYRICGPTGDPSIVWIDNERNDELQLAPTFRTFIERLTASASFDQ